MREFQTRYWKNRTHFLALLKSLVGPVIENTHWTRQECKGGQESHDPWDLVQQSYGIDSLLDATQDIVCDVSSGPINKASRPTKGELSHDIVAVMERDNIDGDGFPGVFP